MENRDLEIEMYKERINTLEKELATYRSRYGSLENPSSNTKEEKIEQAKVVAKKGIEMSKDIFSITKNVFGKAKESFREELEKQKTTKGDAPTSPSQPEGTNSSENIQTNDLEKK